VRFASTMKTELNRSSGGYRSFARIGQVAWIVVALLAVGALTDGGAAAASSSAPASAQLSLHAAPDVLSVTVSPSSGTFGSCRGGDSTSPSELGFPDGGCSLRGLVVTNTGLPGHMMVSGAAMAPVGGGTPWGLCNGSDGTTPSCNNGGRPGPDQYSLILESSGRSVLDLSTQPQCDTPFGGLTASCNAAPGQSNTQALTLFGPESTSSGASSYTTTITWTVTP
jgi:hypothetical protein